MIALQNLTKIYPPDKVIFRDINCDLSRGEFILLTGPAGSGKSLLFRMILRYEMPTRGQVIVFGRNTSQLKQREIPFLRRRIGYIAQEAKLMRPRTVLENLTNILHATGTFGKQAENKSKNILESLGLENYLSLYPSDLSRSQQQKLLIARALILQPAILLADEPLSYLEQEDSLRVTQMIEDIHKQGTLVIWASQKMDKLDIANKKFIEFQNSSIQITETPVIDVYQSREETVSITSEK